jgi:hypothetical protein
MYSMKGVLNYQFMMAFISTLQQVVRDEQLIANTYTALAGKQQEIVHRILLETLASQAVRKALYFRILLYRLGSAVLSEHPSQ